MHTCPVEPPPPTWECLWFITSLNKSSMAPYRTYSLIPARLEIMTTHCDWHLCKGGQSFIISKNNRIHCYIVGCTCVHISSAHTCHRAVRRKFDRTLSTFELTSLQIPLRRYLRTVNVFKHQTWSTDSNQASNHSP